VGITIKQSHAKQTTRSLTLSCGEKEETTRLVSP